MKAAHSVRQNVIANFSGKAWSLLMNLAFVPLYIRFLGIEAYALVGAFVFLTVLLSILDLGLSMTLNRRVAWLSSANENGGEIRDLVRTLEIPYWAVGLVLGICILSLAPFIGRDWLSAQGLTTVTVIQAIRLMGLITAFQWPKSLYSGGLLGLQRQMSLNFVIIVMASLKGAGAVLVLWLVQPTIQAFFLWQMIVSGVQTLLLAILLWRALPAADKPPVFRKRLLSENWHFAAGMTGISVMVTILTQMDKVILSRLLTLEMFGYYVLAASVGASLNYLVNPIFSALFPRFTQLAAGGERDALARLYHKGCQFVSLVVLPISITVILFSPELLSLWLRNPVLVQNTYILVSLLTVGTTLNSLVSLPFALQLSCGWTSLSFYKNVISVILLIPLMILMVHWWGALGAVFAWILLNISYVLFEIPIMHHRLLKGEMMKWYLVDVGLPAAIVIVITGTARLLVSGQEPLYVLLMVICFTLLLAFACLSIILPCTREWLQRDIRQLRDNLWHKSLGHITAQQRKTSFYRDDLGRNQ